MLPSNILMFVCFKVLPFIIYWKLQGNNTASLVNFKWLFFFNQDRVLCREVDTFVNLILLLIDPYTLLFNGCNSSHYFWHINGKWGFRRKEAVVTWQQDPFIHSGLQQWAVQNSDWKWSDSTFIEKAYWTFIKHTGSRKEFSKRYKQNPHDRFCDHHSQTFGLRSLLHS